MHQDEGIFSYTGQGLGQQYHIAQLNPCHADILYPVTHGRHVLTRAATVTFCHCLAHHGSQFLCTPAVIGLGGYQGRIGRSKKVGHITRSIRAEHRALALDQRLKAFQIPRQTLNSVTVVAQYLQRVIQRLRHFQATGDHGIESGALVVVDGQLLVSVGFAFEVYPVAHHMGKLFHALWNGFEYLVAIFVRVFGGDGIGSYRAVKLRQYDRHGYKCTRHPLLVLDPVVVILKHRNGTEHRHVALAQPCDGRVRVIECYTAVGHEHNGIGVYRLQEGQALVKSGHGVDVQPFISKGADQGVHMVAV